MNPIKNIHKKYFLEGKGLWQKGYLKEAAEA